MLTDSPVLDRPTDGEQTELLFLPLWQWPLVDPDDIVLDEARAALHHTTEPDLPILEAVLAGLHRLAA